VFSLAAVRIARLLVKQKELQSSSHKSTTLLELAEIASKLHLDDVCD
jgi:hypothetical protein